MKNVNPQGSFFMLGCECIVEVLHLFKINIQLSLMSKNRAVRPARPLAVCLEQIATHSEPAEWLNISQSYRIANCSWF